MSHAFMPTREEIGDPFAAMERVRKLRAQMYAPVVRKEVIQVIPVINKPIEDSKKSEDKPKAEPLRDIINLSGNADLQIGVRIISEVALQYGLSSRDIKSQRQSGNLVEARHKTAWRLRNETLMSLPQIGRLLGGRDHSTIISSLRRYQLLMNSGNHERYLRAHEFVKNNRPT